VIKFPHGMKKLRKLEDEDLQEEVDTRVALSIFNLKPCRLSSSRKTEPGASN